MADAAKTPGSTQFSSALAREKIALQAGSMMDGGVNVPSLGPMPVGDAAEAGMPMSPQSSATADEPVRTIFLRGLPADVKEREIHNLFRLVQNYEYSTLRVGTNAQVLSPFLCWLCAKKPEAVEF